MQNVGQGGQPAQMYSHQGLSVTGNLPGIYPVAGMHPASHQQMAYSQHLVPIVS